jgi:hypothetical protein
VRASIIDLLTVIIMFRQDIGDPTMINKPSLKRPRVRRKSSEQLSLQAWLKQAEQVRAHVQQDLKNRTLPDILDQIHLAREERDNDVLGST